MKIAAALRSLAAVTVLSLLSHSVLANDGCQIISGTQQVDYGRFIRDDMRSGKTDVDGIAYQWLAAQTRTFDVTVLCDEPQKIRLFIDGPARKNTVFRFGQNGAINLKVKNGRMDDRSVQLATGARGATLTQGADSQTVKPGFGIAPFDGQVLTGRQFVVTVEVTTYLSQKAFQSRDNAQIEEILNLNFEAQP